jgi:hypothetical protein
MILSRLLTSLLAIPPVLMVAYWAIGRLWIADVFFYSSIAASVAGLLTLIAAVVMAMSDNGLPTKVIVKAVLALFSPLWLFGAFLIVAVMHGR